MPYRDPRVSRDKVLVSQYTSARANEDFGCLLRFSAFGHATLQTSSQPPQSSDEDWISVDPDASLWRSICENFQSDAANLQRFLFKLYELRKVNIGKRALFQRSLFSV